MSGTGGGGGGPNKGRPPHMGGGGGGGGGGRNQVFDSNGPDGRIRGNAHQVMERYLALARDASSQGDRVAAENYYQHAEHYFRLVNAFNQSNGQRRPQGSPTPAEDQAEVVYSEDDDADGNNNNGNNNNGNGYSESEQDSNGGAQEPVGA